MKPILLTGLLMILGPAAVTAQWHSEGHGRRQTLFSSWTDVSAFGAPIVELGNVTDEFATHVGGGGALLFDNTFFLGGYGMGMTNGPAVQLGENPGETANLDYGHGGFWLGVNFFPTSPIHPVLSGRIGWGKAKLTEDGTGTLSALGANTLQDNIFVATPMAGLELNVTDWFVIRGEYGYRFVNGLSIPGLEETDLDNGFFSLTFGFGGF